MAYDGSDFVGIDDQAYDDGYPVDTWLDQRVRANNLYLDANPQYITNAFLSGTVAPLTGAPYYNIRPWCSVDWSAPVSIPYWLESGVAGADMALWTYASSGAGTTQLTLTDSSLQRVIANDAGTFNGDIESTGNEVMSATLSSGFARQEWGGLQLWVQSTRVSSAATLSLTTVGRTATRIINTDTAIGYPTSLPTSTSLDVSAILTTDGVSTDLLAANVTTGDLLTGTVTGAADTVDRHSITYLQCRTAGIRQRFTGQEIPVSAASLAARRAVRGSDETKLAQQVQSIYDRRTLIAWGPSGYLPPERDETWPGLMPMRFRGVQSNASSGIAQALLQTSALWRRDGGTMYVAMHLVGVYHGGAPSTGTGSSDWTLSVSMEEPNGSDTDWSSPNVLLSGSRTVSVPTHSSSVNFDPRGSRLLSMRRWNYSQTTGPSSQDWLYIHRDGQLYREDLSLITTVVIEVDAAALSTGDFGMLRVDADYDTGSFSGFDTSSTTPAALGYQLELVCTGWSIWQGA